MNADHDKQAKDQLRQTREAVVESMKLIAEVRESSAAYQREAARFRAAIEAARESLTKANSN